MAANRHHKKKTDEEFPILCETCLGDNPFVRMTKEPHGKACKVCDRPFTVYRWRPGSNARYKKTELCHTCAKLKNVCQTCVLDLKYGLPVQVRDSQMAEYEKLSIPKSDINREFFIENHERQMGTHGGVGGYGMGTANGGPEMIGAPPGMMGGAGGKAPTQGLLKRLARKKPYYDRNRSKLCSFFARGECNRGDRCPYRHEMPKEGPLAKQNIKDRYYGVNDPVALKMLRRATEDAPELKAPEDQSITTLWVGNIPPQTVDMDLRLVFGPFGEIGSVRVVLHKACAFVTFLRRSSAEQAASTLYNKLSIRGIPCRLRWGHKSNRERKHAGDAAAATSSAPPGMAGPPPPGMAPPQAQGGAAPYYPSQDPNNFSAKLNV